MYALVRALCAVKLTASGHTRTRLAAPVSLPESDTRHKGKPVLAGDEDVPVLSPATICDLVHVMSQIYTAAMREHPPIVLVNPFDHLELPVIEPRPVEFLEHDEAEALYAAIEAIGHAVADADRARHRGGPAAG